ncbi:MAG: NAD+ synthase [Thermoplasmatales archaeon]|nr:MAG: NAD+ synthase [Thermoplasmatales archaeon]
MPTDYEEIATIIKDFIRTYVEKCGCKGVAIGLSGGIDSAVTAILCKQALGKNKVTCLFLPDETTPKIDIKHKQLIVKKFDLNCEEKNITNLVKEAIGNCIIKPEKYAIANIKARLRMTLLFENANMTKNIVCGTSNKSELLIGYFTKYGDGGADIQPLGDLYKTQVRKLAKHLKIPKEIISKPPSAGLLRGQTDEGELKLSYKKLDKILMGLERKIETEDIAKESDVKKSDVERIKKMRINSQHKRRSPLIPKIGLRTPGMDWRSPILRD